MEIWHSRRCTICPCKLRPMIAQLEDGMLKKNTYTGFGIEVCGCYESWKSRFCLNTIKDMVVMKASFHKQPIPNKDHKSYVVTWYVISLEKRLILSQQIKIFVTCMANWNVVSQEKKPILSQAIKTHRSNLELDRSV